MDIYLPIAEMPVSVLLILGMGAAVGFISGLFGIGGGFLMTPLLIFVGIPPAVAVASQTAQIVASYTTSALGALRRRALDVKLAAILVAGGAVGVVADHEPLGLGDPDFLDPHVVGDLGVAALARQRGLDLRGVRPQLLPDDVGVIALA